MKTWIENLHENGTPVMWIKHTTLSFSFQGVCLVITKWLLLRVVITDRNKLTFSLFNYKIVYFHLLILISLLLVLTSFSCLGGKWLYLSIVLLSHLLKTIAYE